MTPYATDNDKWTLYAGECSAVMKAVIPDESIDMSIQSPPYDNLRDYNGFEFDYKPVIEQLYRVTKPGGVAVWVVADATVNGSETGTSFRQALYAMECGFNLHDTMIYQTSKPPMNDNRYQACFEYMFIFSRGKARTFNPLTVRAAYAGKRTNSTFYRADGTKKNRYHTRPIAQFKPRENIWHYVERPDNGHPAIFPEALARDHIISWSNPGDTVLDCFIGSGTTAKMALMTGRKVVGIDISSEYLDIAIKRIDLTCLPLFEQVTVDEQREQLSLL